MQHYTCSFSNALLSGRCGCSQAAKDCVAEKEFAACLDENNAKKCNKIYDYLRKNSEFATGSVLQNNLTVAQQNKIRIGGIKALNALLFDTENVDDISYVVDTLLKKYSDITHIPLQNILPKITTFNIRKS
jgi:hypothetical protein